MISYYTLITIFLGHFVFDFLLQTHWQASNKSKNNLALTSHVLTYSIGLSLIGIANYQYFNSNTFAIFVISNTVLHWITDYFTSRQSAKLFGKDWHNFFGIIGFDQFVHYATLTGTFIWITQ